MNHLVGKVIERLINNVVNHDMTNMQYWPRYKTKLIIFLTSTVCLEKYFLKTLNTSRLALLERLIQIPLVHRQGSAHH